MPSKVKIRTIISILSVDIVVISGQSALIPENTRRAFPETAVSTREERKGENEQKSSKHKFISHSITQPFPGPCQKTGAGLTDKKWKILVKRERLHQHYCSSLYIFKRKCSGFTLWEIKVACCTWPHCCHGTMKATVRTYVSTGNMSYNLRYETRWKGPLLCI